MARRIRSIKPEIIEPTAIAHGLPLPASGRHKFTYAVTDGEFVKVGRTWHLPRRLIAIQVACPRRLRLLGFVASDIERRVHVQLAAVGVVRIVGEWFDFNEKTIEVLTSAGLCEPT